MQYAVLVLWGYTNIIMKATFPYKFNKFASAIKISATGANTISSCCMSHPHCTQQSVNSANIFELVEYRRSC